MLRSGAPVDGSKAFAGIQEIGPGELKFDRSVPITTGIELVGQGAETRITWLGGPQDPPLFDIRSFADNGNAHAIKLRKFQVVCPNGGKVIGVNRTKSGDYWPARHVERLLLDEVTIRGGSIDLSKDDDDLLPVGDDGTPITGEHYENIFNNVEFYDPIHYAIRLDGFRNHFNGRIIGVTKSPIAPAQFYGDTGFGAATRFELYTDGPLAWFGSLTMKTGYVHRGDFNAPFGLHFEHHPSRKPVISVEQEFSDFHGVSYGGTSDWRWRMRDNAALYLSRATNPGAVVGQGTLSIAGKETVISEAQK